METEVKKIPYLDLKAINEPYEKEIKDAINKVVNSGWYLQGEAVKRFEKSYAQFIGTEYCISCANGTDALKLMLMGELAIGNLQKGDEVVTSGGIAGKVTKVADDFVVIEVSDNVELKFQKVAIAATLPKGTLKAI